MGETRIARNALFELKALMRQGRLLSSGHRFFGSDNNRPQRRAMTPRTMPNSFAQIVLYSWPLVVFILFKRLPLREALVWSIIAGYLLLPLRAGFNLPVLPTVDKTFILSVSAAVMCYGVNRHLKLVSLSATRKPAPETRHAKPIPQPIRFEPKRGQLLFWGLLAILFTTPFLTAVQNGEPIIKGTLYIPGMSWYDAMAMNSNILIALIPFFLARRFLASNEAHKILLQVLVIACLAYSLLILYEVRMSPQLNKIIYGFFPHKSFFQHMRSDGFRPLVFMTHGLVLSLFVAFSVLAAVTLWKSGAQTGKNRAFWLFSGLWLFGVLFLTKSLGAFALVLLFAPIILTLGRKSHLLVAAVVAAVVLLYPMARSTNIVPVEKIHAFAQYINEDRAHSFKYRLDNEDILLARANEKPLAGWGSWGRNRIYSDTGKSISTPDGYWVIVMGSYGWLGYLAQFGLLCLPLILLGLRRNRLQLSVITCGLAIILSVGLIDLIPNAAIGPVFWLIGGSILGRYQTADHAAEVSNVKKTSLHAPAKKYVAPEALSETESSHPLHQRRPRKVPLD